MSTYQEPKRYMFHNFIRIFIIFSLLLSCKIDLGFIQILLLTLGTSYLIAKQLNFIRITIKNIIIKKILNDNLLLSRILQNSYLIKFTGIIISIFLAISTIGYIYLADILTITIITIDIIIFIALNEYLQIRFHNLFQKDIAQFLQSILPVVVNYIVLATLLTIVSFFAYSSIDITEIPGKVSNE